jgi:ATP-dependent Lon protease
MSDFKPSLKIYPAISLHKTVIFPGEIATLKLEAQHNRNVLKAVQNQDQKIALLFYSTPTPLASAERLEIGIEARILNQNYSGLEQEEITIQGLRRMRVIDFHPDADELFMQGDVDFLETVDIELTEDHEITLFNQNDVLSQTIESPKLTSLVSHLEKYEFDLALLEDLPVEDVSNEDQQVITQVLKIYERLSKAHYRFPKDRYPILRNFRENGERLIDLMVQFCDFDKNNKIQLMRPVHLKDRIEALLDIMNSELEKHELSIELEKKTKVDIEASRKEYYLRQQMKSIRKELGEEDMVEDEVERYQAELKSLNLSEDVTIEVQREIDRLKNIQPSSSEFQVIKTYLDRFFSLPWHTETEEKIDLPKVRTALENEHYGLESVKERILEYLAVRKLNPSHKGSILCFSGPPGVGKTSLGKSIADAIGRHFLRISVGGVKDEAEIRGHRRTYVGSLPGKIMNALIRTKSKNPLLMLDEIDKMGSDQRGDPASALLEVLDPEQNASFTDHYFNIPFDLSKVLFIATANYLHDIPKPLLDRLEVITIEGYTETEKLKITQNHLLPKILKDHGLESQHIDFQEPAIRSVIRGWTREAGVRNLQRAVQKICRKMAREIVEQVPQVQIQSLTEDKVPHYLGTMAYTHDEGVSGSNIGAVNGLAWTASGGEVLVIEAIKMKGHGKLVITGKLGEVMKESVQAAHSYIRSCADRLGIDFSVFENQDLHIHFPAGAVPKDGPSAGVTVTLAIASLLSQQKVRSDIAMTGEVTLRGKVLAVGGIKDKVLAAYRMNLKYVALPKHNIKDLDELPKEVKDQIQFIPLDHVDELLNFALVKDDVVGLN